EHLRHARPEEAFEVADKVVVMNHGRIEQVGTPIEVFEHPANAFVMDFLGNVNVLPVRVEGGRLLPGETGGGEGAVDMLTPRRNRARSSSRNTRFNTSLARSRSPTSPRSPHTPPGDLELATFSIH